MYSNKSDPQPSFSNPTPRDFYEDGWVVWRYFTRKLIVLPHSSAPTSAIGFRGREYFTRNRNRIFCWAMKIRFFVAYPKTLFVICSIDICGGHFIEIVSKDKNCQNWSGPRWFMCPVAIWAVLFVGAYKSPRLNCSIEYFSVAPKFVICVRARNQCHTRKTPSKSCHIKISFSSLSLNTLVTECA